MDRNYTILNAEASSCLKTLLFSQKASCLWSGITVLISFILDPSILKDFYTNLPLNITTMKVLGDGVFKTNNLVSQIKRY